MLQSKLLPISHIPSSISKHALPRQDVFKWLKCLPCLALQIYLLMVCSLLTSCPSVLAQSANPHAVSLYNLGLSAYKQGSPESAIIFFKRAADIDPDLVDAQYNLGVLYQSEHRLKEAVPRFEQVLRIKPQDQDAQFQLGLALFDLSRPLEARPHLLAIAPNSPHFAEAQKKIAQIDGQAANPPINSNPNIQANPTAPNSEIGSTNINPYAINQTPAAPSNEVNPNLSQQTNPYGSTPTCSL